MEKNGRNGQSDIVAQCELIVAEYAQAYFAYEAAYEKSRLNGSERRLVIVGAVASVIAAAVLCAVFILQ